MLQWRREIPRKNVAATAAEKLVELDPLFQVDSDNIGICFEMVVIILRLRLHFDFYLVEVGELAINQYGSSCEVKSVGRFKECSCNKLKLGTIKEV